ncbi:MAG: hypothetical protein GF334_11030 [Candidatus Altiarchaeales archaeon]|nr:hypothetical protein [Candidatus Altiarchaeales archaeon]
MGQPVIVDTSVIGHGEEGIESNRIKLRYVPIPDYKAYFIANKIGNPELEDHLSTERPE